MEIPVLLYHVVKPEPDPNNDYQYELARFKEHMHYLHEQGYTTLKLINILPCWTARRRKFQRSRS